MEKWIVYAFISMLFAGVTSVIAKLGLTGISGEMGLTIRTVFVFIFVLIFAVVAVPKQEFGMISQQNVFWLALSSVTTSLSWLYYYRALKLGDVSTIAIIDKGSFIVAVLLAWLLLKEQMTLRIVLGCTMILGGLLIVSRR